MNLYHALCGDRDRRYGHARTLLLAALLGSVTPLAQARLSARVDATAESGRICSATAQLLRRACGHEAEDDLLVATAKCINFADHAPRARCLLEAKDARAQGNEECERLAQSRQAACAALGQAPYDPLFTPDRFDSDFRNLSMPNPYFPLTIGHRWEYRGGDERTTVGVRNATKLIAGVSCIVVRDLVYKDGVLKEATDDWFAAGLDGSAWYCGEEVKDYEVFDGDRPQHPELVSIDGTFKHGVAYDKAGLIMPAQPVTGQTYREEFSLGNAEDVAEIVSVNYSYGAGHGLDRLVPRGLAQRLCHNDCVVVKAYSLLDPGVFELKYYARGIGLFLETNPGEGTSLQLVACNFDQRCVALPQP